MRARVNNLLGVTFLFTAITASIASPRLTLTGKAVESNGKPLEHATVLVYYAGVKTGYSTYCPSCYADGGKSAVTNTAGAYTIKNLSPDLWFTLLIVRDGYFSEFVRSIDPSGTYRQTLSSK